MAYDRGYWLPVSAAAKQMGLSNKRIYQLIHAGVLGARKIDSTWLISQVSVEMRIAEMARKAAAKNKERQI